MDNLDKRIENLFNPDLTDSAPIKKNCVEYANENGDPLYWTDREGNKHEIQFMDSGHIENCLKMLKKLRKNLSFPCFLSDLAQEVAEYDYYQKTEIIEYWIDLFKRELTERGL